MVAKLPEPTSHTNAPVCPWCGHVMKDAWELSDSQKTDCGECLKPIHVYRHAAITYNTFPVEGGPNDPK